MKTAIVTGSSKGIGRAISQRLLKLDYRVYGLSRTEDYNLANQDVSGLPLENFVPISCDLLNTDHLMSVIDHIRKQEPTIDLLINNAGIGCFGPHEQLNIEELQKMIRLNLEVPILLCRLLLRDLKLSHGHIINISSVTAKKISTHGCAYAATKAGLSHFSDSLFEETRKTGLRITTIQPDITQSNFYDPLDFTYDEAAAASILPEQVADAVEYALSAGANLDVQEITLRPQLNKIRRK